MASYVRAYMLNGPHTDQFAEALRPDVIHRRIRQLSAFYASPLGQKMQAKMPELMNRSIQISQRVMMPRIQKAMAQSQQAAAGK